jgi:cysteine desulfurase
MIYFDNAATTVLDKRVFNEMTPYLLEHFGNPSSTHTVGRQAKVAIEAARKSIAKQLNCLSSELFFTSCATEANNMVIKGVVDRFNIQHIITSELEHHAVLHPIEHLENQGKVTVHYVSNNKQGKIDLSHLDELLNKFPQAFVSIMHGNNELGNINPIDEIANLCKKHKAYFHSDTVQTIGHLPIDLNNLPIDYLVASAHKFHGPKGIGFLFVRKERRFTPLLLGGAQEKDLRAGTENVAGIIGMVKAFELAHQDLRKTELHFELLKTYLIEEINTRFNFITINGTQENALQNIISLSIAPEKSNAMLLFSLDLKGICISGGSACASGSVKSHVAEALTMDPKQGVLRVSLSRFNTKEEITILINTFEEIFN